MQEYIVFLVRVQRRRKESSRSIAHLLMSFLLRQPNATQKCNQHYIIIRNTSCSKYANRYFPYWKIMFLSSIFKKLLGNHVVDFVEICKVCARKAIIEAAERIINSD